MINFPKLSETLKHPPRPERCMSCGAKKPCFIWREHDQLDRETDTLISLCEECGRSIIDKHPRLYSRIEPFTPLPGAMFICCDCVYRNGLACLNPLLKSRGGPGLPIQFPKPTVACIDGRTKGKDWGRIQAMHRPGEITCQGRKTTQGDTV